MSHNLTAGFAGVCGAALLAATPQPAVAQKDTNFQISAVASSGDSISDRWRVNSKEKNKPVLLDQPPYAFGNYPINHEPVIVLQHDFRLSHDEKITFRLETQKNDSSSFQDIIKSGTLPFMDRSADGGGKMGLKFKKGVLLSYKREF